jgi:hypothetical protein
MSLYSDGGMILTGETEELGEKPVPVPLYTTNPTWIDPGANPGLRSQRPATNDLSHGTAPVEKLILRYILKQYCVREKAGPSWV